MNQTFAFYEARAQESAAEAAVAKLDMVRERALRSEKTWRNLADQAQRVQLEREMADRIRSDRQEADRLHIERGRAARQEAARLLLETAP